MSGPLKLLSAVAMLAIMAGCARSGAPTTTPNPGTSPSSAPAKQNRDVAIAMWSAPNNFNPINTDSNYGGLPIGIMFDTLATWNDKGDFVPRLAEKWDISPDYTTFTFHLNPKAKWHDGKPVTAKDVLFTVNTIANKEIPNNRGAYVALLKGTNADGKSTGAAVEGIKAVDEQTVVITTKAPMDPLAVLEKFGTAMPVLPEHILGSVAPKDFDKNPFFMDPKVGSGPFKFGKYAPAQYVQLVRNDDYYLGKPKLENVYIRIMQATTAVAALQKGEIDMTAGSGIGEVPIADWDKVQKLENVDAVSFPSKGWQFMDFNFGRDYFKDPKVRQAFVYGINRKLMVDNLLKGNGQIIEGPYTSLYKYQDKTIKIRDYDANKAKQLLTEAGWDFNRNLTLLVPLGNMVREQSADVIMANLQQIGVKVQVQKMDFPTLQARRGKQDYDLSLVGWSSLLDPDVSSQVRTGAVYNNGKFSNPKADELLDKGVVTAEFNARKQVYDQLQKLLYDDPNFVYLYSPNTLAAVSKRMVNVKQSALGLTWNIYEWDVK
jgi:peptide/nickel transport system substrate-binding protein